MPWILALDSETHYISTRFIIGTCNDWASDVVACDHWCHAASFDAIFAVAIWIPFVCCIRNGLADWVARIETVELDDEWRVACRRGSADANKNKLNVFNNE